MLKVLNFFKNLLKKLFCIFFIDSSKCYDSDCRSKVIGLSVGFNGGLIIEGVSMSLVMRNDQVVTFAPVFKDSYGNDVDTLGSAPVWALSNPDVGSLEVSEGGLTAVFTPTGVKGATQVSLMVDSDPGDGVEALVGTADITVLSGKAVVVQLAGVLDNKPVQTVPSVTEAPVAETPAEPAPTEEPVEPQPTDAPVEDPVVEQPASTEAPVEEPVATDAPVEDQPVEAPATTETPVEEPAPTDAPEQPVV